MVKNVLCVSENRKETVVSTGFTENFIWLNFLKFHLLTVKTKKYKEASELIELKTTNVFEYSKIQMWQAMTQMKAFKLNLQGLKMTQN